MHDTNRPGIGLPRRAFAMAKYGPGVLLMPETGKQATTGLDKLQAGDLVFFYTGETPGMAVQHSGIFLGVDNDGHYRFLSSRSTPNGPSLGDSGGASVIDGSAGYWSIRFRTARRI